MRFERQTGNERIDFDSLWNRLSSNPKLKVEKTRCDSDASVPNYIMRLPSGFLRVKAGNYGVGMDDGSVYTDVVCVSRHFVRKPIYEITLTDISNEGGDDVKFSVRTTADHTCMIVENDEFGNPISTDEGFMFFRASASQVHEGDLMCVDCDDTLLGEQWCDRAMRVKSVSLDENARGTWVYDLETKSDRHVYFANGVLVHNSQFINLSPVTKCKCAEDGVPTDTIFSKLPDSTREKVIKEAYRILDAANANVEKLVNRECHTLHGNILHYALEYITAEGLYFKKKHYIVHKIISDGFPCDKFKYSGISVKKAEIPVSMKDFLKNIFESTMTGDWTEADYRKEVEKAYSTFVSLDWADISYYKKYRTVKRTVSLTESEKGAQVHARAANFYNQLIEKLGLAGRYPKIGVGDEFRYSWILPTNEYGMDCIAFKGTFPDEFRKLFKPDYETMFEKIFMDSLKNYIRIMGFRKSDPTRQEEDPSFSLF